MTSPSRSPHPRQPARAAALDGTPPAQATLAAIGIAASALAVALGAVLAAIVAAVR